MTEILNADGTRSTVVEDVKLTKAEFDELVKAKAEKAQNEANMSAELAELRKKNRELAEKKSPEAEPPKELSKEVAAEFAKRDAEVLKLASEQATVEFLDSHPELSKEKDTDGSKFAAFQKALGRISLAGVKTKQDYAQVLNDALRLTGEVSQPPMPNYSSTPRSAISIPGSPPSAQLASPELKLVQTSFGGDVEKYLKLKAKRPEYVEELLRWVRV